AGVTLIQPELIVIDDDVEIGPDTIIHPFTTIRAGTRIGSRCEIGPHVNLSRARIGDDVSIVASTVADSTMGNGSDAGPYAHVRHDTRVGERVHVGNFAEIK